MTERHKEMWSGVLVAGLMLTILLGGYVVLKLAIG
jgi:hypothetical protein